MENRVENRKLRDILSMRTNIGWECVKKMEPGSLQQFPVTG